MKSEIAENVERWNNTLIGYVMGVKKNFLHLKACVSRIWKPKRSFDVYSRVNGYFFFKFGMKEDCVSVLHEEPWHFDGRLIIPKRWNEKLGMERDLLSSIPVWIKFPSLPLCLWSEKIISETASLICKPLYRDKATASGKTLALARCFVEIAATSKRPSRKMLEVEGDMEELQVEYEWIPPLCNKCSCFGLVSSQCPTIQRFFFYVWRPEGNEDGTGTISEPAKGRAPAQDTGKGKNPIEPQDDRQIIENANSDGDSDGEIVIPERHKDYVGNMDSG